MDSAGRRTNGKIPQLRDYKINWQRQAETKMPLEVQWMRQGGGPQTPESTTEDQAKQNAQNASIAWM